MSIICTMIYVLSAIIRGSDSCCSLLREYIVTVVYTYNANTRHSFRVRLLTFYILFSLRGLPAVVGTRADSLGLPVALGLGIRVFGDVAAAADS